MIDLHNYTNGHVARRQAERMAMSNPTRQTESLGIGRIVVGTFACIAVMVMVFWS